MSRAKGMMIREEWFEPLLTLDASSLKNLFSSMIEFYKNGSTTEDFIGQAGVVGQLVYSQMKKSIINTKNSINGGNPKLISKKPMPKPGGERVDASLFDVFWSAYPKKVGKDYAKKCFLKLKVDKALLEDMLKAIETQKKSDQWKQNNGAYIPHPSTWLNQGRWKDEINTENSIFDNFRIGEHI